MKNVADSNSICSSVTRADYGAIRTDLELETLQTHDQVSLIRETASVVLISAPLIVTLFLQYMITVFAILSVSQLGKQELAAVSLATITYNVGNSIFNGMATSLDTYCAQAYGSGNPRLVGVYFQRGTAMLLVTSVPVILFWCYSASVLLLVVPQRDLLDLAQTYLRYLSFGAPGYVFFETGKRFLQCQGIYTAAQYSLFMVVPLNIGLNFLLVWNKTYGIGFIGAPISIAISYWTMSIFLWMYVVFIDGKRCWFGVNLREAFNIKEWASMFSLAINGTAMLLSEFIAFEVLTLTASRFGTTALAAQSIASTMATLAFQVPFGVSVALSTKMADRVGLQDLVSVKRLMRVTYTLGTIVGVVDTLVLVAFSKIIAACFSTDKEVISLGSKVVAILGINQFYDCPNVIFAGCLRGQGRQAVGSRLNLIIYYLIALPLALLLAFHFGLGIFGLWAGLGVGIFVLASSEFYCVYNSQWPEILESARKRISG